MRLICPNCDAQYEVDSSLIPASGRDVQCSNCGKTWFQERVESPAAVRIARPVPRRVPEVVAADDQSFDEPVDDGLGDEAAEFFRKTIAGTDRPAAEAEEITPATEPEPVQEEPVPAETVAASEEIETSDEDDKSDGDASDDFDAPSDGPDGEALQRPKIDPGVLGILKAEAEREIAARRAEQQTVETQGELGLAEPERPAPTGTVEARTARLRGQDTDAGSATNGGAALPDVEEINSTLAASSDREGTASHQAAADETRKRRAGFRLGFSVLMFLTAAFILTYVFAPQLAEAVPSLRAPLTSYVDWANGMRLAVDGLLGRVVDWLTAQVA